MTIDEAIKQLEEPGWRTTAYHPPEYTEAIQLGIEALKWFKKYRNMVDFHEGELLPGENLE